MRNSSVDTKVRERSYFVPKYVPASIIPDPRESKISEEHLIESMKKTDASVFFIDSIKCSSEILLSLGSGIMDAGTYLGTK